MMEEEIAEYCSQYNYLYKECSELYREEASIAGLSNSAFMLLFLLSNKKEYSQRQICEQLNLSRQTINTTVLNLEKQGIIFFRAIPDNQKEKLVILSEKGKRFVNDVIMDFVNAEKKVFFQMGTADVKEHLRLMKRYNELLQAELKKISDKQSEN